MTTETLKLDPIVELIVGLLIVRRDLRPSWVKTYEDARRCGEYWSKRLRREVLRDDTHLS